MTVTMETNVDSRIVRRLCRQTGVRLSCTYRLLFVVLHLSENEKYIYNIKT